MGNGVGRGLNEGVKTASGLMMQALQMQIQQQRYNQLDERYNKAFDWNAEVKRGDAGLPPSYVEEEQAEQAAATRPAVPSSTPRETPGQLGIPQTTFPVGKPVQPMPAPAPVGARGLLPVPTNPRMPLPGIGRNLGLGVGMNRFGRTR